MSDDRHTSQSGSFLVRCWAEPRELDGEPEVLRVYVRNLRTGEEHYIGDPASLGEMLLREAQAETERGAGGRAHRAQTG